MLVPTLFAAFTGLAFSPALFLAGFREKPVLFLSPLMGQLAQAGIFATIFNAIFLLIAGRFVERAVGGVGVAALFVAGLYAGAVARLLLTPASFTPGFSPSGGLFAIVGAYLMLYGIPRVLPLNLQGSRPVQIAALALFWAVLQLLFALAAGGLDWSVQIVEPLGGLAAGTALARPILAWRYRRA